MKRTLSLLLALSCLLALCACGAASDEPASAQISAAPSSGPVLAEPVYPSMAPCPRQEDYLKDTGGLDRTFYDASRAWREDLMALRNQPAGYAASLTPWFGACIRQTLSGGDTENRVVSPLNLTMALAMLAEVAGGSSRQQLLDLLGAEDLDALRAAASALWLQSYQDDGQTRSILANSLWLRLGTVYVQPTLDDLAAVYYASAFQGQMGSPEYDALLQGWIGEQTGGLLEKQASGLSLDPGTVLALVSTVCFKAPWVSEFSPALTEDGLFRGPDGEERVPFLHGDREMPWYWGEHFSAVGLDMENGGQMWFLLPEEGMSPAELPEDPEAMAFLLLQNKDAWEKQRIPLVHLTIPKFDVSSDLELTPALQRLGVTDVFDSSRSDFTPLTREPETLYVSRVEHAARVKIDEEGCEAAAYTIVEAPAEEAAVEPEWEEVDFILDRPFLFCITNAGGLPLFVGLVSHPGEK